MKNEEMNIFLGRSTVYPAGALFSLFSRLFQFSSDLSTLLSFLLLLAPANYVLSFSSL